MARIENIKIRGLARIGAVCLAVWGALVAAKGLYDTVIGEPEANAYAPEAWGFVSQQEWLRYAGFETVYGLACLGLAVYVWSYARRLPETIQRPAQSESKLFLHD